ncbi:MAG: hypothetical protein KC776_30290 [Myxococcales bacterium]|nr:hypothetical protein [Myxococcales bacterium]MCB9579053.1 hypothetical protein [Polyangiaceae bacterium]
MSTVLIVVEHFSSESANIAAAVKARGETIVVAERDSELPAGESRRREQEGVPVVSIGGELAELAVALEGLVRDEHVTVVHVVHAGPAGWAGSVAARSAGVANVVSLSGEDLASGLFRVPEAAFIPEMVRGATVATASSEDVAGKASRLFQRPVEPVVSGSDSEGALYVALYCRARSEPFTRRRL